MIEPEMPLTSRFPTHARQAEMLKEARAFERLHPTLVEPYLGHYVAIFKGDLVDHDPNPEALLMRVRERYPNEIVLRRLVEKTAIKELVFRSPRFESDRDDR